MLESIMNYRSRLIITILSPVVGLGLYAAEINSSGLDIRADKADSNLLTSVGRLEGNVELKHNGILIKGDFAEIHSADETNPQIFVINGSPMTFMQETPVANLTAKAGKLVYTPSLEKMQLDDDVSIIQNIEGAEFKIIANQLQLDFKIGQLYELVAAGVPAILSHTVGDQNIQIQAEKITWDSEEQIAILTKAKVLDQSTIFSADEIKYNSKTGEISAIGEGDTRPSYRYNPDEDTEEDKNNGR